MSEQTVIDFIDGLSCILCVRNRVAEYTFDLATIHMELDGGGFAVEANDSVPEFFDSLIARSIFAIVKENNIDTSRGVPPPLVMAAYRQAEIEFARINSVVEEVKRARTVGEANEVAAKVGGFVVAACYVLESLDGQELDRCEARSDGDAWAKFEERLIETQGVKKGHFSPSQFRIRLVAAIGAAGKIGRKLTEAERAMMN